MTEPDIKFSPLLILLVAAALGAMAWLAVMNSMNPGLLLAGRAKFIEPVLDECFINGLAITAAIEENNRLAYEIKEEREETDPFSKNKYRVIVRGKKLKDPEIFCTVMIKRAYLLAFMQQLKPKFYFSEKNNALWVELVDEMRKLGIMAPGNSDISVTFADCAQAKKLYDSLQAFFAMSKSNNYNFR